MPATISKNPNWTTCPRCSEPLLIDPTTGKPDICANCQSNASPMAFMRLSMIGFGLLAVISLVAFCLWVYFF
jgi:hypothetical protein